jgi:uncharacterized protein
MTDITELNPIPTMNVPVAPASLSVHGLWGELLQKTCDNWMLKVSDDLLLSGFRSKPGIQPWIGEHIGKFLMGSIPTSFLLAGQDEEKTALLREKNRALVENLVAQQEADGYLGTLLPEQRWYAPEKDRSTAEVLYYLKDGVWDVWTHKYCILALLNDFQTRGWEPALQAAIRAADLVIQVFGPGGQNINHSDCHAGLASGSFLEPLMRLYQITHFDRYLQFARHMLRGWEDPDGPRILAVLKAGGDVASIGRGKAYEMMSCFVGLVEYARATGDADILRVVMQARDQIADRHRYVTGGMSNSEFFWRSGLFPEWTSMETCVTFTWIQLNLRLFELTGDARALDLVEESTWNQLLPALSPLGDTWSYHLSMIGPKRFFRKWVQGVQSAGKIGEGAPISCCHTNGQRGLALIPQYAYTVQADGTLGVNFYGAWNATVSLPGAGRVSVEQETSFPAGEMVVFHFKPETDQVYRVQFRVPAWSNETLINGQVVASPSYRMELHGEQTVQISFDLHPRIIFCGYEARGKCAVAYGPLICAVDNPPAEASLDSVILNLGHGSPDQKLEAHVENGWPIVQAPACTIPTLANFKPVYQDIGKVDLVPVLFAGLQNNPGLREIIQGESMPSLNQERVAIERFPEYRVLLPFFWSPD